jgi:hypothetical protein
MNKWGKTLVQQQSRVRGAHGSSSFFLDKGLYTVALTFHLPGCPAEAIFPSTLLTWTECEKHSHAYAPTWSWPNAQMVSACQH